MSSNRIKYYATILGGVGGLFGWLAIWLLFEADFVNVYMRSAIWGSAVGFFIGFFVGASQGIINQVPGRALWEGLIGGFMGLVGGTVSGCFAEWVFSLVNYPFLGRGVSWALLGMFIGVSEGITARGFDSDRATKGLVGGALGGLLGGLAFESTSLFQWPQTTGRAVLVVLGLFIGFGLVQFVSSGQGWLVVQSAKLVKRREYPLSRKAATYIGSVFEKAGVFLPKDPAVEPRHARVGFKGGRYFIEDLDTRSGTLVNGCRISRQHELNPGDTIGVGSARLIFELRTPKAKPVGPDRS